MMLSERSALRWPVGLALTLAAGLAASIAFLVVAASQPPDRIAEDTWRAGDSFNAAQRAHTLARARGWDLALQAERASDGVRVTVTPLTRGEPLTKSVTASLRRERPGRVDYDVDVLLTRAGEGWVARVPLPLAGRWVLHARAGDGEAFVERDFELERAP
jgi:nitrogen fixation protein FixH